MSFGGFLNTNFWNNYRQKSSELDELLKKEDCTVEKLLEIEDCLMEFKCNNDGLVNWFTHDKLKVLIDFISTMPPTDATEARNYKLPFTASEIFATELNPVFEKFFEAPEEHVAVVEDAEADKEEEPAKDILFEDGEEQEKVEEGHDLLNQLLEEKENEVKEVTEQTAALTLDDNVSEATTDEEKSEEVKETTTTDAEDIAEAKESLAVHEAVSDEEDQDQVKVEPVPVVEAETETNETKEEAEEEKEEKVIEEPVIENIDVEVVENKEET